MCIFFGGDSFELKHIFTLTHKYIVYLSKKEGNINKTKFIFLFYRNLTNYKVVQLHCSPNYPKQHHLNQYNLHMTLLCMLPGYLCYLLRLISIYIYHHICKKKKRFSLINNILERIAKHNFYFFISELACQTFFVCPSFCMATANIPFSANVV